MEPFLSLGKLPLGNAFLKEEDISKEEKFELELGFCQNCKLVQQTSPPPTTNLVHDYQNYKYVPFGKTLQDHYAFLARKITEELNLGSGAFVVDIGSNDGTLLNAIRRQAPYWHVLGIEPAVEISETARQNGVRTMTEFWSTDLKDRILATDGQADVVIMTQTLQHIPDVKQAVKDVYGLLKPGGVFVVEGRYFGDTVRLCSFDTIYHEMLYFFTLESLMRLLKSVGMNVFKAERVDIYGGSLRVYAIKDRYIPQVDVSISKILSDDFGLNLIETYWEFADKVRARAKELHKVIVKIKGSNKIAGYGAPSTGTTLLNFCGIGKEHIDYIVDDNPLKQGLLQPGTHIPIVDSSYLEKPETRPDYLLIIAWRLKDEILKKVSASNMGYIIPLPELQTGVT